MGDVGAFYDAMWTECAACHRVNPAARHRHRLIAARVARIVGSRPARVLDVGAGPGTLLAELAKSVPHAELAASDISPRSFELCRESGLGIEPFPLDLARADFATAYSDYLSRYDVVVCSEVLEHLDDDLGAARRLRSLLAREGSLIVTVPGGERSRYDERIGHVRHYTRRTLATLLVDAGLTPLEVTAWGFPFHNAYRSLVRLTSRLVFARRAASSPTSSADSPVSADPSLSPAMSRLYALTSRVFYPLYFLNAPLWGEQLIAVAQRG